MSINLMKFFKAAEISGAGKRRLKYLNKAALVVVDEVGFIPLSPAEANLFLKKFIIPLDILYYV